MHGSRHFHREVRGELPRVIGLPDVGDAAGPIRVPGEPLLFVPIHLVEIGPIQPPVAIRKDNELPVVARRYRALHLPLGRIAETQEADGKDVLGQSKQVPMDLVVLHDVADIAGTDTERLRRDDRRLRRDERVAAREKQVAFLWLPQRLALRRQRSSTPESK